MQKLWKQEAKQGGFLSNMAAKFHHRIKLLLLQFAGFLRFCVCGNLHISISERVRKPWKSKPIWNRATPSSSASNLKLLYQKSWLGAKNLSRVLLKNSWRYISFSDSSTQNDLEWWVTFSQILKQGRKRKGNLKIIIIIINKKIKWNLNKIWFLSN